MIDIPFCVAGGIRSVDDARAVLHAGADKVSVNSPALERPDLIDELAAAFGVQCVVVGIDSLRDDDGEWRVRQYTGDPTRPARWRGTRWTWVEEAQAARRRRNRAESPRQAAMAWSAAASRSRE